MGTGKADCYVAKAKRSKTGSGKAKCYVERAERSKTVAGKANCYVAKAERSKMDGGEAKCYVAGADRSEMGQGEIFFAFMYIYIFVNSLYLRRKMNGAYEEGNYSTKKEDR